MSRQSQAAAAVASATTALQNLGRYVPSTVSQLKGYIDNQLGGRGADPKPTVIWKSFEQYTVRRPGGDQTHLFLVLGLLDGFQVYKAQSVEDLHLVASERSGPIGHAKILQDCGAGSGPLLLVSSASDTPSFPTKCAKIYSIEQRQFIHQIRFRSPISALHVGPTAFAVSLENELHVCSAKGPNFDFLFNTRCYPNPLGTGVCSMGPRWIAFAGVEPLRSPFTRSSMVSPGASPGSLHGAGAAQPPPFTLAPPASGSALSDVLAAPFNASSNTLSNAGKDLAAGLYNISEYGRKKFSSYIGGDSAADQLASSSPGADPSEHAGSVVVRDLSRPLYVAHFSAHPRTPLGALQFDPSGLLLATVEQKGQYINVYRIVAAPTASELRERLRTRLSSEAEATRGALGDADTDVDLLFGGNDGLAPAGLAPPLFVTRHLYRLRRGISHASIRSLSFSSDSRLLAFASQTTAHVFAINPHGGPVTPQTHGPRVLGAGTEGGAETGAFMNPFESPRTLDLDSVLQVRFGSHISSSAASAASTATAALSSLASVVTGAAPSPAPTSSAPASLAPAVVAFFPFSTGVHSARDAVRRSSDADGPDSVRGRPGGASRRGVRLFDQLLVFTPSESLTVYSVKAKLVPHGAQPGSGILSGLAAVAAAAATSASASVGGIASRAAGEDKALRPLSASPPLGPASAPSALALDAGPGFSSAVGSGKPWEDVEERPARLDLDFEATGVQNFDFAGASVAVDAAAGTRVSAREIERDSVAAAPRQPYLSRVNAFHQSLSKEAQAQLRSQWLANVELHTYDPDSNHVPLWASPQFTLRSFDPDAQRATAFGSKGPSNPSQLLLRTLLEEWPSTALQYNKFSSYPGLQHLGEPTASVKADKRSIKDGRLDRPELSDPPGFQALSQDLQHALALSLPEGSAGQDNLTGHYSDPNRAPVSVQVHGSYYGARGHVPASSGVPQAALGPLQAAYSSNLTDFPNQSEEPRSGPFLLNAVNWDYDRFAPPSEGPAATSATPPAPAGPMPSRSAATLSSGPSSGPVFQLLDDYQQDPSAAQAASRRADKSQSAAQVFESFFASEPRGRLTSPEPSSAADSASPTQLVRSRTGQSLGSRDSKESDSDEHGRGTPRRSSHASVESPFEVVGSLPSSPSRVLSPLSATGIALGDDSLDPSAPVPLAPVPSPIEPAAHKGHSKHKHTHKDGIAPLKGGQLQEPPALPPLAVGGAVARSSGPSTPSSAPLAKQPTPTARPDSRGSVAPSAPSSSRPLKDLLRTSPTRSSSSLANGPEPSTQQPPQPKDSKILSEGPTTASSSMSLRNRKNA